MSRPDAPKPDVETDGDDQGSIHTEGREPGPTLGSCLRTIEPEEDSIFN